MIKNQVIPKSIVIFKQVCRHYLLTHSTALTNTTGHTKFLNTKSYIQEAFCMYIGFNINNILKSKLNLNKLPFLIHFF